MFPFDSIVLYSIMFKKKENGHVKEMADVSSFIRFSGTTKRTQWVSKKNIVCNPENTVCNAGFSALITDVMSAQRVNWLVLSY